MDSTPEIIVISGQRNVGKTLLCLKLIERLKSANLSIKGIVSPGLYMGGKKVGIIARDIASGEERQFAKYSLGWDIQKPEREWLFLDEGISWANERIKNAFPADIILIDELGYLEFEENDGWMAAMEGLDKGLFKHAVVVIRPDLLIQAGNRWNISGTIVVKQGDNFSEISEKIADQLMDKA